jgi:hypothetical protein|tara:strand:- start:4362 stop:4754 length:393 start_codon:yes stop_codon:yes gene_type:complete
MDVLFGEEDTAKDGRVGLSVSAEQEVVDDMGQREPAWVRYMPEKEASSRSKLSGSASKVPPTKASRQIRKGKFAYSAVLTRHGRRKNEDVPKETIGNNDRHESANANRGKRSLRDRVVTEKELSLLINGL